MEISKPQSPSPPLPDPTGATITVPVRKKPGLKPWATPELWAFLETGIPDYRSAQAIKGKVMHPITGTRMAAGDCTHVKQWYQNHGNVKKVETVARISNIFAKPKTHALKAEEVYSCLYYREHIKPMVDEQKAGVSSHAEVLRIIKDTTKELFEVESPEIHAEMAAHMKEQVVLPSTAEHNDETITPEIVLGAADGQIRAFNAALSKATGFHAGEDKHGRTFGQAFPNFKETYLTLFTRFLQEDKDTPGKSLQDQSVGSSSKPVPEDGEVEIGELDKRIATESAMNTNGTEGHKAVDDVDVEQELACASEGQQSIEPPPSSINPLPSPHVAEDNGQIPHPCPSPELNRDTNDVHELLEIEGTSPADGDDASEQLPEYRDGEGDDRQPLEEIKEMPSGDASSQTPPRDIINPTVELPTDEPTVAKSRKCQRSQAKVTKSQVIL
ncbi:uncharacterized protein ARMOST_16856 [Armillaria ostoyae]|uniref:Uncharacterized protein n=1 Tax=Armillaria ostoyae TaxID=47428 RepID=A0A284RXE0_ARMOS|nr:uncharacterized protein ARMOST_16856 [Armillaria ostoyae]